MKITVNNEEITIFVGAKVKDAIRMYYAKQGKMQPKNLTAVKDAYGHRVGYDGSLLPDSVLYIEE